MPALLLQPGFLPAALGKTCLEKHPGRKEKECRGRQARSRRV